jgi:hypothetical protein
MMGHYRVLLVFTVVAGLVCAGLVVGGPAAGQQAPGQTPSLFQQLLQTREGVYDQSHVLSAVPHAIPGYVAGFLGVILVASLVGFFEMSPITMLLMVAAIGGIVVTFYSPWH